MPEPEIWIDEGPVRDVASAAVARGIGAAWADAARSAAEPSPRRSTTRRPLPDDVRRELESAGGTTKAAKLEERLAAARAAFEADRYGDARRTLVALAREVPTAAAVRELLGLTNYRLGRWREGARELEAFRLLTGSVTQNPVLADCYRALRRYTEVEALWDELKAASPSAALVAEGRIVMAGAMADRGDVEGALALMAPTERNPPRAREHHLRSWYVLADLHERSGDVPRARALFARIVGHEPDFADAAERLAALGP